MKTCIFALLLAALLCVSLLASPVLADSEEPATEDPSAEALEEPAEAADSSAEPAETEESSEAADAPASDESEDVSAEAADGPILTEPDELMPDGLEDGAETGYDYGGTLGALRWGVIDGVLHVSGAGAIPSLYGQEQTAWMPYREGIREIVIEDGITAVGFSAFTRCPYLTTVTFPDSVTAINGAAFYGCPMLNNVTLPEGLNTIGRNAFTDCTGLARIYIPASVTSIGSQAFDRAGLTDIYYGGTAKAWAALGKGEVTGATVSIDGVAGVRFHPSASGLTADSGGQEGRTVLAEGDTEHRVHWTLYDNGTLYLKANDRYGSLYGEEMPWRSYKNQITALVIEAGDALNYIPKRMFYNMDSLESVTVNGSLRDIDAEAFSECDALTEVNIHGNMGGYEGGLASWGGIGERAFLNCKKLEHFNVDGVISKIGDSAFSNCSLSSLDAAVLGDIGVNAFINNNSFCHISPIRGSVGQNAFVNTKKDGKPFFIVSNHSGTLGQSALGQTGNGQNLYYTGTEAEFYAKYENYTLKSVSAYQRIGENVSWFLSDGVLTIVGSGPAIDLLEVTEQPWLNIPGRTWDENREQITEVRIAKTVILGEHMLDGLEDRAERFDGASGAADGIYWILRDGTLYLSGHGTVPDLYLKNDTAWMPYRDQIREIVMEEGITALGSNAFYDFPNLETVTLPVSLKQIGYNAFRACPKLDRVALPEGLETVLDSAFAHCTNLRSVYIPKSVSDIIRSAFSGTGVTDIYYGGTAEEWDALGIGSVTNGTVNLDGTVVTFHPSAPGLTPTALDPPGYPAPTEKPDPTEKPEPTAEPEPTDRPAPTATPRPSARPSGGGDNPKTGDDMPVMGWALAILLCAGGLIALPLARKSRGS